MNQDVHNIFAKDAGSTRQARLIDRYERIIRLTRRLNAVLDLPRLLQIIVEAARDMTGSEASSILLIDPKSRDLYFEAATGSISQEIQPYVVPLDGSIAGWVVRHGEPVRIDDAQQDERHLQTIDLEMAYRTQSLLAVPLSVKGETIGVLEALNKADSKLFDQDDVDLLQILADQAAVAIENARLFEQSDLVAEMVHELRTPLTAILAYADILLDRPVGEEQRVEILETIRGEAERLTDLADEFLELVWLSAGRARLSSTQVDISKVVRNAARVVQPQADERGVNISVRTAGDLPTVSGDEQRLHRVFLNLMSNAIKYNEAGGTVSVTIGVDLDNDDCVRITVTDTGKGISKENLERLFERFFRVPDSEGYAHGTGLGLSIAKQIVDVHCGTIGVESKPGVGSTFAVVLPTHSAGL